MRAFASRQWVRAGALGYALGLVLPMGRGAGEAARAVLLARSTGGARAAVAAVQMQGIVLLSTTVITVPVLVATMALLGPGAAAGLLLVNGLVAGGIGAEHPAGPRAGQAGAAPRRSGEAAGELRAGLRRRGRAPPAGTSRARWAGSPSAGWRRWSSAASRSLPSARQRNPCACWWPAVRLILGSAVGDFIPGQLGATEATLVLGAGALGLTAASAATLALLIHAAQILLGLLCAGLTVALPGPAGTSAGLRWRTRRELRGMTVIPPVVAGAARLGFVLPDRLAGRSRREERAPHARRARGGWLHRLRPRGLLPARRHRAAVRTVAGLPGPPGPALPRRQGRTSLPGHPSEPADRRRALGRPAREPPTAADRAGSTSTSSTATSRTRRSSRWSGRSAPRTGRGRSAPGACRTGAWLASRRIQAAARAGGSAAHGREQPPSLARGLGAAALERAR